MNANHVKRYNDSSLITKLEKLQKQYEVLERELESSYRALMNNSLGKVGNEVGEGEG